MPIGMARKRIAYGAAFAAGIRQRRWVSADGDGEPFRPGLFAAKDRKERIEFGSRGDASSTFAARLSYSSNVGCGVPIKLTQAIPAGEDLLYESGVSNLIEAFQPSSIRPICLAFFYADCWVSTSFLRHIRFRQGAGS